MTTYQGPHVAVRQQFQTSPAAVAIENLPPAIIASAFNVYTKESLDTSYGIINRELLWGDDNVVYNVSVINEDAFNFYPAKVFAKTDFGDVELESADITLSATGVTVNRDSDFSVPGVEKTAGNSTAIIPYYSKAADARGSSGNADDNVLNTLSDSGADFVTDLIAVGDVVVNTTDNTSAVVVEVTDLNNLVLSWDAFPLGTEAYVIYSNAPVMTAAASNQISVPNGSVITSQIRPGQKVFLLNDTVWTEVGEVATAIGSDETKINLASSYPGATTNGFSGQQVVIGAADSSTITKGNLLYDPKAKFVTNDVKTGDVLHFSSLSISGSTTTNLQATVTSVVSEQSIKFNNDDLTAGQDDYDFYKYKFPNAAPQSTIQVYSYDVKRFIGFSQNYGLKMKDVAGTQGVLIKSKTNSTVFTIAIAQGIDTVTMPNVGDIFIISTGNIDDGTNERDAFTYFRPYRVTDRTSDGTDYTIITDSVINLSNDSATETEFTGTGEYLHMWAPKVETEVVGDFRAVRSEENKVVKPISQTDDIYNAWVRDGEESISPYNELAFMMNIVFARAGGKVCYGVNVDATVAGLSSEYQAALEELKIVDSYSHAFGTTVPGVNALMGPYVDSESEPYQGHEKIGIICSDEEDVYLQGSDTGSIATTGIITIPGSAFNPVTAGVAVGDIVKIYNGSGVLQETVNVTETPTVATTVQTDGETAYTGHTMRFMVGRKEAQANKIKAIGAEDNRRVTSIWPGWFTGNTDNGDQVSFPPYYIAAAMAGMDCQVVASQSFTNLPFSIPGISNIALGTNFYFTKLQLDTAASAGVDIMIQDLSPSPNIKSRHDLTTDMSAVQYRERSITKQADVAAKLYRSITAPYVGRYNITNKLLKFLGDVCSIASDTLVKDGVLARASVTKIERDSVIDDKVNIYVEAVAFIAGNYYDITLLVKTR